MLFATAALATATTATAAATDPQPVPAGFTANPMLSRAASWVAGKPVTDYCAKNVPVFNTADVAATGVLPGGAIGYSWIGGTQSFFHPYVCAWLTRWNADRSVDPDNLARALLAVTHEAELLSGVSDESVADCKALAALPKFVTRFFPLRHRLTMHVLMGDAWDAHDQQAEQYLTNCPVR